MAKGIEFCVRLNNDCWLEAQEFLNGDDQEKNIEFHLPKKNLVKLAHYPD
jgi:hypothetical protein